MNNSVGKAQDGTIYFGSINGVCYFNPKDRPSNIILPPVIFTDFKVYGRNPHEDAIDTSIPMTNGKIMLNHNQNIFSITFNVMNKSLQGKVEYAYKLEGLEENWINIIKLHFAIFLIVTINCILRRVIKIRNGRLTTQPCSSASILRFGSVGGLN